jgi:phosphoglycerate dehydrogenase-like enzyme
VTILATLGVLPAIPDLVPNLKYIHLISAGIDRLRHTCIYKDTDISITTSSGIHGPTIAEWVVIQILSSSRRQKTLLDWQRKHVWGTNFELETVRDSVGMRLGVLGYGSIGRQGNITAP